MVLTSARRTAIWQGETVQSGGEEENHENESRVSSLRSVVKARGWNVVRLQWGGGGGAKLRGWKCESMWAEEWKPGEKAKGHWPSWVRPQCREETQTFLPMKTQYCVFYCNRRFTVALDGNQSQLLGCFTLWQILTNAVKFTPHGKCQQWPVHICASKSTV